MPAFFPTPYPDELLYSVIARYVCWRRVKNMSRLGLQLFGAAHPIATVDLPSRIKALADRIPVGSGLTPECFIENNTLFPLYRPFLPKERADRIMKAMMGDSNGTTIHAAVGLRPGAAKTSRFLRYCPKCLAEDEEIYGEPYWHRVHQVPGVHVCPHHETWLEESTVLMSKKIARYEFHALEEKVLRRQGHITAHSGKDLAHHLSVAKGALQLLERNYPPIGPREVTLMYMYHLRERGLASVMNNVKQTELLSSFRDHYGLSFLEQVDSPLDLCSPDNWLSRMVRTRQGVSPPIRHILLMNFLGFTPEYFFAVGRKEYRPFGDGPWPCLNTIVPHYKQMMITACIVSKSCDSPAPHGRFECPLCGFTYSRRGPDCDERDQYRIGRMVSFGPVWEAELVRLASDKSLSLREKGQLLGVDKMTVGKHEQRLNQESGSRDTKALENTKIFEEKKIAQRENWSRLIETHPEMTRTEIRRLAPKVFFWLYKHDHEWLSNYSPKPLPKKKNGDRRVNWSERDRSLKEDILRIAEEMRQMPGKPPRISLHALAARSGNMDITRLKTLKKLPRTKATLELVVESKEDHRIRRVRDVVKAMREKGDPLVHWRIQRRAGLTSGCSKRVAEEIIKAIVGEDFTDKRESGLPKEQIKGKPIQAGTNPNIVDTADYSPV